LVHDLGRGRFAAAIAVAGFAIDEVERTTFVDVWATRKDQLSE
jgi:hypothetical protein